MSGRRKDTQRKENRALSESSVQEPEKEYICRGGRKKVCGKVINKGQGAIECDICETWYHGKCQGVSEEALDAITEHKLFWPCETCQKEILERKVEERLATKMEEGLNQIKVTLDEKLTEQKRAVETSLKVQEEVIENSVKAQAEEKQTYADIVAKTVNEIPKFTEEIKNSAVNLARMVESKKEKEERQNNIILHNIEESRDGDPMRRKAHDTSMFGEVISAVLGDLDRPCLEIEKVYRLGKKREDESAKPRLLLVRLKNKEHVDLMIKNRWLVRQNAPSLGPVFISRDLTKEEREKEGQLRRELEERGKETHRIFRGKVVRK